MKIDLLSKAQLSIINKTNFRYPLAIAEKDYLLAIILKIIYASTLGEKLIFKGGTAIHHLYLDQLRFSEDLDFSATEIITIEALKNIFKDYGFLEIIKYHDSNYALKVERMKFIGPLGQPNSVKLDIDLTQKILLPAVRVPYNNCYMVPVSVMAMDVKEICAEKLRAVNERARYRDFYDLALIMRIYNIAPDEVTSILLKKEIRKPLNKDLVFENLNIAESALLSGSENIFYKESLGSTEIKALIDKLFACL
jgi:uncharacterized protein